MRESLRAARLGTRIFFALHGLIVATWLSRIPAVQAHLRLTPGQLGLALLGTAVGAMVGMPIAGALATRHGSGLVTTVSTVLMAASLMILPLAWDRWSLTAALFLYGVVSGAMDVAMNAQAVVLEQLYGRAIMSAFHALFSFGGMLGSALGALAAAWSVPPISHFSVSALVYGAIGLASGRLLLTSDKGRPGQPVFARITVPLLGLGCLAFCILLNEGAMADWTAVYLRRSLLTSEGTAAAGYAVFSLAMAAGRLAGDRLTDRLGRVTIVRFGALLSAVGLAAALLIGTAPAAYIGFGIAGLGFAAIVPLIFGAAGRSNESAGAGLAAVTTLGYFGFVTGPPVIGLTADHTGLRAALGIVVALSVAVSALAGFVAIHAPMNGDDERAGDRDRAAPQIAGDRR